jgi:hypothetical protein
MISARGYQTFSHSRKKDSISYSHIANRAIRFTIWIMIDTLIAAIAIVLILGAHGVVMRLLWRRMKRVNAPVPRKPPPRPAPPGIDERDPVTGLYRGRGLGANDELIDQGAAARESRWPIN